MTLALTAEPAPLTTDDQGVARVGQTRVTLDTVVVAFREGLSAEEIVEQYPTLELGDVYAVLGYYLHHRDEVDAYLEARRQYAEKTRRENEANFPPEGIRARLMARRHALKR